MNTRVNPPQRVQAARLWALMRRLGQLVISLFVLITLTFIIGRLLPADPVGAIVGELASDEAHEAMRARLGLDQPMIVQYWRYIIQLLQGDLGIAALTGNPVIKDIALVFPATLELATLAIFLSFCLGVPLGLAAAFFRDRWVDHLARVLSLVGSSIPIFWFGILGLLVFYAWLGWVGGPGRVDIWYEGIVPPAAA